MILVFAVGDDDARVLDAASGEDSARRWRPSWLMRRFLRDLEMVLCWVFFDAPAWKQAMLSRFCAPTRKAEAIEVVACESEPTLNVLIAGRAKFTDGLLRCLLSEDARIHAIAVDRDEARDLIVMGATPHALEDIPDQAALFDAVISTDLMQFIGADVLARLPDHAIVLDLAPAPGSVDFESAKKLGRRVFWARSAALGRAVFSPATWGEIRHVLEFCRQARDPEASGAVAPP